jgi:transposase-like protein
VIPTQEDFLLDLDARVRSAVQATIQTVLDEELDRLVGAGPYERSDQRVDVRNGRYERRVVTTAGEVDVRVGRTRGGGAATAPLGRYARRRPEIDAAVTQAYVGGVSTRDMSGVTEALLGKRIGKSTVSRVTKRLEDQVDELRREPLTEPIPNGCGSFVARLDGRSFDHLTRRNCGREGGSGLGTSLAA